ncbi:response regulator [Novispirillum sp. DQ9]|uniref:response regulator n=1 Tax=Novispirillum sp. DQ9 TaxID=3398612 RepID=UPI003C7B8444
MIGFEGRRLNVLIVEDNINFRRLLRTILTTIHVHDVMETEDGASALDLLRTYPADLVLLDWKMEPMDGLEFMRELRRGPHSPNPYLPVIMVSGYTDAALVTAARDAGVNEFLAKPISAKSLLSRLIAVIDTPRPFVKSATYFGPDRRRKQMPLTAPERRNQT